MMARGAKSFAEQARRFGLTPAYYNEIRKGLKTPSLDRALVMASEAGTTVDTLFERAA